MYGFLLVVVAALGFMVPIFLMICKKLSIVNVAQFFAATGTVILAIMTYKSNVTSEKLAKITLNQPRLEIHSFTTDSITEDILDPHGNKWFVDSSIGGTRETKKFLRLKIANVGEKAAIPLDNKSSTCEINLKITDSYRLWALQFLHGNTPLIINKSWQIDTISYHRPQQWNLHYKMPIPREDTLELIIAYATYPDQHVSSIDGKFEVWVWSPQNWSSPILYDRNK